MHRIMKHMVRSLASATENLKLIITGGEKKRASPTAPWVPSP